MVNLGLCLLSLGQFSMDWAQEVSLRLMRWLRLMGLMRWLGWLRWLRWLRWVEVNSNFDPAMAGRMTNEKDGAWGMLGVSPYRD